MAPSQNETLDCRVRVRKYVLIAQPTRWRQKSERVVVQSPMLDIPSTITQVPVKRYHGEEQNCVCFIPRTDIEKDASNIYEKSQVSRATFTVIAHGVAIIDSSPSDDLKYLYGDTFWISIGANTNGYEESVPVINLRTRQSGIIQVDRVCWYPKIRGPGQELWTLGGETRKLKHYGSKKFSSWSWVVCQYMDGTKSTTKNVEIPTKDFAMADRSLLSASDSRALFEVQYRSMQERPTSSGVSSAIVPSPCSIGSNISLLPTPPASPAIVHKAKNEDRETVARQKQVSSSKNLDSLRRIVAMAVKQKSQGPYILRNSVTHPQQLPSSAPRRQSEELIHLDISPDEGDDDLSEEISSPLHTRDSTVSLLDAEGEQLILEEPVNLDGADLFIATLLTDLARDERKEPCISVTASTIISDPSAAIRRDWSRNKPKHNPLLDGLCDMNISNCHYITKSTTRHFHSPPEKCRRPVLASTSTAFGSRHTNPNYPPSNHEHEHCVARLGPFPHTAGDCLLANAPVCFPNHKCCRWDPVDLEGRSIAPDREFYDVKILQQGRKKRIKICDTRSRVELKVAAGFEIEDDDIADLGDAGRSFKAALDAGKLNEEIKNLVDIGSTSYDK
ncbi:hypothetical protein EG329_001846 [Mollisiaceae sp. DMI_Dod_QoI]|nr:hypothetical protein EG329_001846 [Helotiales sp. DMI_Dod_QoI]